MPDHVVIVLHGKKVGWFTGHGPPPVPNAIGEVFAADLQESIDALDAVATGSVISVEIYEPISAVVTADSTAYTADNTTWPTADGGILEGATDFTDAAVAIVADVLEAADAIDELDGAVIAAGVAIIHEAADAADVLDAEVVSEAAVGGGGISRPLRLFPVEGEGYGLLPRLEGEAVGVVGVIGSGAAVLPRLGGAAAGFVGVAGRSAGQLAVIRGTAAGERGAAGHCDAILKGLSITGDGAIGVRGAGAGMIGKLEAAASGRHDDDEAAVLTFLLAA